MGYPKLLKNYSNYSFDELATLYELFHLQAEALKSGEQKPEVLNRISLLQREAKFQALDRARFKYKASGRPSEQWPKALQGEPYCKWKITTMERLGLEIDESLRLQAKIEEEIKTNQVKKIEEGDNK